MYLGKPRNESAYLSESDSFKARLLGRLKKGKAVKGELYSYYLLRRKLSI